jgi:hypothetical protein
MSLWAEGLAAAPHHPLGPSSCGLNPEHSAAFSFCSASYWITPCLQTINMYALFSWLVVHFLHAAAAFLAVT